ARAAGIVRPALQEPVRPASCGLHFRSPCGRHRAACTSRARAGSTVLECAQPRPDLFRRRKMKKRIGIAWNTLFALVGGVLCVGLLAGGLSFFLGGSPAQAQKPAAAAQKGGEDETGPADVAPGWPQPLGHAGYTWGSQGGVFAESPNRIYIANRGELPIPEKAPEGYTG